jgi:hypothetical protein
MSSTCLPGPVQIFISTGKEASGCCWMHGHWCLMEDHKSLTTKAGSPLSYPAGPHSWGSELELPPSSLMIWWASSLRSWTAFSILDIKGKEKPDLRGHHPQMKRVQWLAMS